MNDQTFGSFDVVWVRLSDIHPHPQIQRQFRRSWRIAGPKFEKIPAPGVRKDLA